MDGKKENARKKLEETVNSIDEVISDLQIIIDKRNHFFGLVMY